MKTNENQSSPHPLRLPEITIPSLDFYYTHFKVAGTHEWELVVKWLGRLSLAKLSPSLFSFIPQKHEAYKLKVKFNKIQQELDNNL